MAETKEQEKKRIEFETELERYAQYTKGSQQVRLEEQRKVVLRLAGFLTDEKPKTDAQSPGKSTAKASTKP